MKIIILNILIVKALVAQPRYQTEYDNLIEDYNFHLIYDSDCLNRKIAHTQPNGDTTSSLYDDINNIVTKVDPAGNKTKY